MGGRYVCGWIVTCLLSVSVSAFVMKVVLMTNMNGYFENQVNRCGIGLSSVQFSLSVVSNSLQPHGLQLARPPYPSPTPRIY